MGIKISLFWVLFLTTLSSGLTLASDGGSCTLGPKAGGRVFDCLETVRDSLRAGTLNPTEAQFQVITCNPQAFSDDQALRETGERLLAMMRARVAFGEKLSTKETVQMKILESLMAEPAAAISAKAVAILRKAGIAPTGITRGSEPLVVERLQKSPELRSAFGQVFGPLIARDLNRLLAPKDLSGLRAIFLGSAVLVPNVTPDIPNPYLIPSELPKKQKKPTVLSVTDFEKRFAVSLQNLDFSLNQYVDSMIRYNEFAGSWNGTREPGKLTTLATTSNVALAAALTQLKNLEIELGVDTSLYHAELDALNEAVALNATCAKAALEKMRWVIAGQTALTVGKPFAIGAAAVGAGYLTIGAGGLVAIGTWGLAALQTEAAADLGAGALAAAGHALGIYVVAELTDRAAKKRIAEQEAAQQAALAKERKAQQTSAIPKTLPSATPSTDDSSHQDQETSTVEPKLPPALSSSGGFGKADLPTATADLELSSLSLSELASRIDVALGKVPPKQDLPLAEPNSETPKTLPAPMPLPKPTASTPRPEQAKKPDKKDDIGPLLTPKNKAELIEDAKAYLELWRDQHELPAEMGSFFLQTEVQDLASPENTVMFTIWTKQYNEDEAIYRDSRDLDDLRKRLFDLHFTRFCRDYSRIGDFYQQNCANCEAQTKLLISVVHELGMPIPEGKVLAVQVFDDHIQPVLYDPERREVLELVSGDPVQGLSGPLYQPAILFYAYLKGQKVEPPVTEAELLIASADPDKVNHDKRQDSENQDQAQTDQSQSNDKLYQEPSAGNPSGGAQGKPGAGQSQGKPGAASAGAAGGAAGGSGGGAGGASGGGSAGGAGGAQAGGAGGGGGGGKSTNHANGHGSWSTNSEMAYPNAPGSYQPGGLTPPEKARLEYRRLGEGTEPGNGTGQAGKGGSGSGGRGGNGDGTGAQGQGGKGGAGKGGAGKGTGKGGAQGAEGQGGAGGRGGGQGKGGEGGDGKDGNGSGQGANGKGGASGKGGGAGSSAAGNGDGQGIGPRSDDDIESKAEFPDDSRNWSALEVAPYAKNELGYFQTGSARVLYAANDQTFSEFKNNDRYKTLTPSEAQLQFWMQVADASGNHEKTQECLGTPTEPHIFRRALTENTDGAEFEYVFCTHREDMVVFRDESDANEYSNLSPAKRPLYLSRLALERLQELDKSKAISNLHAFLKDPEKIKTLNQFEREALIEAIKEAVSFEKKIEASTIQTMDELQSPELRKKYYGLYKEILKTSFFQTLATEVNGFNRRMASDPLSALAWVNALAPAQKKDFFEAYFELGTAMRWPRSWSRLDRLYSGDAEAAGAQKPAETGSLDFLQIMSDPIHVRLGLKKSKITDKKPGEKVDLSKVVWLDIDHFDPAILKGKPNGKEKPKGKKKMGDRVLWLEPQTFISAILSSWEDPQKMKDATRVPPILRFSPYLRNYFSTAMLGDSKKSPYETRLIYAFRPITENPWLTFNEPHQVFGGAEWGRVYADATKLVSLVVDPMPPTMNANEIRLPNFFVSGGVQVPKDLFDILYPLYYAHSRTGFSVRISPTNEPPVRGLREELLAEKMDPEKVNRLLLVLKAIARENAAQSAPDHARVP